MRIATISGSLQARSGNRDLLRAVERLAPPGVDFVPFEGLRELPFFDPDLDAGEPPATVTAWRRAIEDADALLIASPEYGHSLPGVLKNAIDWVIGSGELHRKPVALTASVGDRSRGRKGLGALAQTLGAVDAVIVWNEPTVRGPAFEAGLEALVNAVSRAAEPPGAAEGQFTDSSESAR